LDDVPVPKIVEPGDCIGKVTLSTICGSDIHIVHGGMADVRYPIVVGHEFCAEIVETGPAVKRLKVGDKVVSSCVAFCGECWYCKQGLYAHCSTARYGCFGVYGQEGCQTTYVLMPGADNYAYNIPEGLTEQDVLFTGDILSTGYFGAENADIKIGDVVAVIGAGPVGMCCMATTKLWGPSLVIAVDTVQSRLDVCVKEGIADIGLNPLEVNVPEAIRELTGGRGADKTIECVGAKPTFDLALECVRGGGNMSTIGVFEKPVELPMDKIWAKNIKLGWGFVPMNKMPELISLIQRGKLDTNFLCTHKAPLNDIVRGYDVFGNKKENCLKWLVTPWEK
jgi:alcohol dehydrogenase